MSTVFIVIFILLPIILLRLVFNEIVWRYPIIYTGIGAVAFFYGIYGLFFGSKTSWAESVGIGIMIMSFSIFFHIMRYTDKVQKKAEEVELKNNEKALKIACPKCSAIRDNIPNRWIGKKVRCYSCRHVYSLSEEHIVHRYGMTTNSDA